MKYDRATATEHFLAEIQAGRLELSDIRKQLEKESVPDEEIRAVFHLVDSRIQRDMLKQAANTKYRNVMYSGLVLCGLGLVITIGTYLRVVDIGGSYIIAFGPVLSGAAMFLIGRENLKN